MSSSIVTKTYRTDPRTFFQNNGRVSRFHISIRYLNGQSLGPQNLAISGLEDGILWNPADSGLKPLENCFEAWWSLAMKPRQLGHQKNQLWSNSQGTPTRGCQGMPGDARGWTWCQFQAVLFHVGSETAFLVWTHGNLRKSPVVDLFTFGL